jgi:AcrR family transcriptional regulator
MATTPRPAHDRRASSSERLIQAALEMFSRRGMAATTREIAETAGLNEVTLFRLFESKDQLLAAVVEEVVRAESEALDRVDLDRFDLQRDIPELARVFYETHEKYQAFLRTMLAHRLHPKLTEQIMRRVIQPLRDKFIAYLREGQRCGAVRADVDLSPAVDAFTGMIFASALRRSVYAPGYTSESYLATCTEIFIRGIQSPSRTGCDDASEHLHL